MSNRLSCPVTGCSYTFLSSKGRTNHYRSLHAGGLNVPVPNVQAPLPPNPFDFNNGFDPFDDPEGHPPTPPASPAPPPAPPLPPPRPEEGPFKISHPHLTALPRDADGNAVPAGTKPLPRNPERNQWSNEEKRQFKTADFTYRKASLSGPLIDELLQLWTESLEEYGAEGPFASHADLYAYIDEIKHGDSPWHCLLARWTGPIDDNSPSWKRKEYPVLYRDTDVVCTNMLDNPTFATGFDTIPYVEVNASNKRQWSDFMSGNFAYDQSTRIYEDDPTTEGAMYCPIILGSDKTTVSVATGHIEYHPLYLSLGNFFGSMRRAHRNAILPVAFLAIPHCDRKHDNDAAFRRFKKQLYHSSISAVLQPLKSAMTTPVLRRCPDGHFRFVIYDLACYIADYPEQVYLTGVVQNWCPKCTALSIDLDGELAAPRTEDYVNGLIDTWDPGTLWDEYGIDCDIIPFTADFPRADIHTMISPDLLHQLIKGTFKDHLVSWVEEYLVIVHGRTRADAIMDDIDRRIAAVPAFGGLRRFPHGRRFKQWTGDDSKALMKVYLPAIAGYVPNEMVRCISSFLDFCYIVRRPMFTEDTLTQLQATLDNFHRDREIFRTSNVRPEGFSLPRQHSMKHYLPLIQLFAAPAGLCSSITESRHITAVKKPWRRSNRYKALGQMLVINQRLDKLAAARADYVERGMLPLTYSTTLPTLPKEVRFPERRASVADEDNEDEDQDHEAAMSHVALARTRVRKLPRQLNELAVTLNQPSLPNLARHFLHDQLHPDGPSSQDVDLDDCPRITSKISVFNSAVAAFYAPSDPSGVHGMRRERIRSTSSWRNRGPRRDCAFVVEDQSKLGMRGLTVVRVRLFFSFDYHGTTYPCALVEWFKRSGRSPDDATGMWKVKPDFRGHHREVTVLHLDTFLRAAHLIPVYGDDPLPVDFSYMYSLEEGVFDLFYVNKYADHHANEVAF